MWQGNLMGEDNSINVASIKVTHNGSELLAEYLLGIEKLVVESQINAPAMFELVLNMSDMEKGTWRGIDLDNFQLGDAIEVSLGMGLAEKIISGEVTGIEPSFNVDAKVTIRGMDKLHRLRFGNFRRSFQEMKDSEIADQIASEAGLSGNAESTKAVHQYVFQNNISNYSFLIERANHIGFEIAADGDDLLFRKSQEDQEPAYTLEYGLDMDQFSAALKVLTSGSTVEYRGWDPMKKKEISGKAKEGSAFSKMKGKQDGFVFSSSIQDSTVAVLNYPPVDDSNAEEMAKARYNSFLKNFITGEGQSIGNAGILAGRTVELKGIGERFSGIYYLIYTKHIYEKKTGYITKFKVQRTAA